MTILEAIDDYCAIARHELGHSQATDYAYVAAMRRFARWLAANGQPDPPVGDVTAQLLRRNTSA
jgi:hypothetical protein